MRQQQFGQRFEAGFPGDLGLGPALRLVWQVDVFQTRLAVGGENRGLQRRIELALLADRVEDRGAARFELTQVRQALFKRAQLRVVETAGDLLALPGDERNRRALVEQRDRLLDLLLADAELLRDLAENVAHARPSDSPRVDQPIPRGRRLWTIATRPIKAAGERF